MDRNRPHLCGDAAYKFLILATWRFYSWTKLEDGDCNAPNKAAINGGAMALHMFRRVIFPPSRFRKGKKITLNKTRQLSGLRDGDVIASLLSSHIIVLTR